MTAQAVVRKVALATSVLKLEVGERLLASFEPHLADRVRAEMAVVRQRGWNRPKLVARALGEEATFASAKPVLETAWMDVLALQLDSATYARVLAAQEADQRNFQLSFLDPERAHDVRQQLDIVPELPERLRTATLAAVKSLGTTNMGASR